MKPKTYVSPHPNFDIYIDKQRLHFESGYLQTDNPKLVKALDNHPKYGSRFFSEDDYNMILSKKNQYSDAMIRKAVQAQHDKVIGLERDNERLEAELEELKKASSEPKRSGRKPNES